jgi:transcriptional regulator with XRE-family HTH domain
MIEQPNASRRARNVDAHVGQRVRALRLTCGMSQEKLAEKLDLTFQQVQKYEKGLNRISASRLYELAGIFRVPVGALFEGLEQAEANEVARALDAIATRSDLELVRAAAALSPAQQRALLELARSITSKPEV